MRSRFFAALLLALAPALAGGAAPPPEEHGEPGASLDDLAWLAGSWRGEITGAGAATRFEAHYSAPEGGVILGTSKAFTAAGDLAWFEFERFELRDGALVVTPYPNGRPSVPFTLAEVDREARQAVFVNPDHDYPTRITYRRAAPDRLVLRVAGDTADAPVMEFTLSLLP